MNILVTGGAGYIGGFMTRRLLSENYQVVVVDNLERGHTIALDERAPFLQGSLLDKQFLKQIFSHYDFDAVIHFAGYISVSESFQKPSMYFINNLLATINLLDQMLESNVMNIIFSSTAAVYGNPFHIPIPEDHPKNPESPYGESKLMVERVLNWYQKINGLHYVSLRYFNAAGAALDGSIGEHHNPESHIIPNAINALITHKPFILYGTDYTTPDGTCVRDYIHVLDLVEAHMLALKKITEQEGGYVYNVGTGQGKSNKEVIDMVEKVSGRSLEVVYEKKRPGDAAILIADPTKIQKELGFTPQYSDLQTIVTTAWKWHSSHQF